MIFRCPPNTTARDGQGDRLFGVTRKEQSSSQ